MTERRSLTEGLKNTPALDTNAAREFVYAGKVANTPAAKAVVPPAAGIARAPISTRIRDDLAKALKRASLERQLEGVEPSTLQGILEEAIEPWLREHGYLK